MNALYQGTTLKLPEKLASAIVLYQGTTLVVPLRLIIKNCHHEATLVAEGSAFRIFPHPV
jgi:hypothetical protein